MGRIPEDIERFLEGNIESIDQLEVLRVLGHNPAREWGAAELAAEVQASPSALANHLAALLSRGLVSRVSREGHSFWRHGADTPERQAMLSRLLQLYQERPVTLIRTVYARASGQFQAFAEAFRRRKEG